MATLIILVAVLAAIALAHVAEVCHQNGDPHCKTEEELKNQKVDEISSLVVHTVISTCLIAMCIMICMYEDAF